MRRQSTNSSEEQDQWSRSSRTDALPPPHSHRAQSTGQVQVQQLQNDRSASLRSGAATSNPDMTQHAPSDPQTGTRRSPAVSTQSADSDRARRVLSRFKLTIGSTSPVLIRDDRLGFLCLPDPSVKRPDFIVSAYLV
ncbi:hypothetical protein ANCCAN_17160 [Ancylostoma caninum]|uniref:Uncharacterized protein n=1 Tax=Ancylostoma caninum TaxID=29170 RepID=A0A368FZR5_ANCCA|nr:hypothetical protein ANCCAN_17160 [Ancylostoma caninum]